MISFEYEIKDEMGIHARPAGILVKMVAGLDSRVTIQCGEKQADARRLLAVMGMGIKCGDTITVNVEGENETEDAVAVENFIKENL